MATSHRILIFTNAGSIIMPELQTIIDREQAKRQLILNSLLTNVENFRSDATKAFSDYSLIERSTLENIEADDISSYSVLTAWEQELMPIQQSLSDTRSDDNFSIFLIKNLILNNDEIQPKINQIISKREIEVLHNFTNQIYPINEHDEYAEQRQQANILLSKPESDIIQIKNHQIDYILYAEIARLNNITVIDLHTSLFSRILGNLRLRSERKKTVKAENERLQFIKNRLEILSNMNGGLIVEIFEIKWDLITIFSLRNLYEKKINKLSVDDAKNAVKRLAIFDAETLKFRNEQIDKLSINSDQVSLEITRSMTTNIDNLLLRIFDLTNIQKNQLLLYSKEYRELRAEQTAIKNLQSERM